MTGSVTYSFPRAVQGSGSRDNGCTSSIPTNLMSTTDTLLLSDATSTPAGPFTGDLGQVLGLLRETFGIEFDLVDGTSGELIHRSVEQPSSDWELKAELCKEVSRRCRPEVIGDEDPFAVLAIPLTGGVKSPTLAVATFVTRPIVPGEQFMRSSYTLGMDPQDAAIWAARQTPWAPEILGRVGDLLMERMADAKRIKKLERETENISSHLATTYEEISILYRLTQNLRISESDEDLGLLALEWMHEVMPARGLAIYLLSAVEKSTESSHQNTRGKPVLLRHGECPLDQAQFGQLIDYLDLTSEHHPRVINRSAADYSDWPFSEIRQMIAVPLAEGDNLFGWLAVFNHATGEDFGTVESSLLGSVAAILGIHGGNLELYRQQAELFAGIVRVLTSAIDAKDPYTCGHSDRVARISVRLAQEIGCDAETVNTIYLSGLLHDIGKIGIDDNVLRKPGILTESEYEHIKEHVTIGHKILMELKSLDDVLPVVLHHHESWDGSGYPIHLPGEKIPLSARIVAVADAFDAMASKRPYRDIMSDEKIEEIFKSGSAKQWDPTVVEAFFRSREDVKEIVSGSDDRRGVDQGRLK
jgi:putative nucleotidyltransferase with HDIG domain